MVSTVSEWFRFLGVRDTNEASAELHRMITRLDEAYDAVNYVIKLVNGAPGAELDGVLLVTRSTLVEAINLLTETRRRMTQGDPEAA